MAKFDDISLFGPGEPDQPEPTGEEQTQEGAVTEAAPSALEETFAVGSDGEIEPVQYVKEFRTNGDPVYCDKDGNVEPLIPTPEEAKQYADKLIQEASKNRLEVRIDAKASEFDRALSELKESSKKASEEISKAFEAGSKSAAELDRAIAQTEKAFSKPQLLTLCEDAPLRREGKIWEVVIIQEGRSLNDVYYPREALKQSIPLWEGQEVAFYGWDPNNRGHVPDHVERQFPQGTFANNCGFLRGVKDRVRNGRYELYGEFVCTREDLRKQLLEHYEAGGKMPGFSIHAWADPEQFPVEIREGRKVRVVYKITETKELTLVSKPAAGGTATRLVAGQTTENKTGGRDMDLSKVRAYVAGKMPEGVVKEMEAKPLLESAAFYLKEMDQCKALVELAMEFLADGNNEQALKALEKALNAKPEAPAEAPAEEPAEAEEMVEEPVYEGRAKTNEMRGLDSEDAITEALKRVKAIEAQTAKMIEDRAKERAEKAVKEAEAAHKVADQSGGDAGVSNVKPQASVITESSEKFQKSMDILVGYNWRADNSLTEAEQKVYRELEGTRPTRSTRALYEMGSGDMTGNRANKRGSLTEAYTNTTFSNALDSSITRVLQFNFAQMPEAKWKGFVKEVGADTLIQRDRSIIGGIGRLPVVSEGGTYTDLAQPAEYTSNYTLEKRGGYVSVTEEAILNDRIGVVQAIPQSLMNSALEAEEALVYKALIANLGGGGINTDTSYTGSVMYHANHANYSTTALSNAALVTARKMMENTLVFSRETALNEAMDITSGTTSFDVDDATGIRAGMILRIDAEDMEVTAVSTNTLTVVRGVRGTTAASHTDNTKAFAFSGVLSWQSLGGFKMYVIVPTELKDEAYVALASQYVPGGGNNDVNTLYADFNAGNIQIVSVDSHYLGGDTTNWYTAAPWQVVPGLEFGYLDGQRAPMLVNHTQDLSEQVFLADTMRYKVKHRIGANNMFHEGRTGHVVAG